MVMAVETLASVVAVATADGEGDGDGNGDDDGGENRVSGGSGSDSG